MQIINNWLNGSRNFTVGATLFKTFGTNEALKKLIEQGETPFCKELLVNELQQLITSGQPIEVAQSPQAKETSVMPDGADDILIAIKNEWLPLYQRMIYLRHQLDKEFEDMNSTVAIEYRKPIAFEILDLDQQCAAIWAKRDYYLKEGKLPFVPESKFVVPTNPIELAKAITNTKRYIRRYATELKNEPGNAKYAQLHKDFKERHKLLTGEEYKEAK